MSEDKELIVQANEGFYRAFESLDTGQMEKVWARDDSIQCGHPGWQILRGWKAVMESWRRIFENTPEIRFMLTDISVEVRGAIAWVTLYENLIGKVEGQNVSATVLTTNIFEKTAEGWRLIHHHGSSVAQPPPQADPTTVH
jgi:ketosteroid isomerase-like protein